MIKRRSKQPQILCHQAIFVIHQANSPYIRRFQQKIPQITN